MHPLIKIIDEYASDLKLDVQNKGDNSISIWSSSYLGLQLKVDITDLNFFNFYFSIRTTSWYYSGERTDLHDIISLIFAAFVKKVGLCSIHFINVQNPATGSDVEIYSRYLIPEQVDQALINLNNIDEDRIKLLISSLSIFEQYFWNVFNGCPCEECRKSLNYTFEYRWKEIHSKRLLKAFRIFGETNNINYCERTLPTWFYFRDFKKRITLIQSKELIPFVKALVEKELDIIGGVTGDIIIYSGFNNFNNYKLVKKIENYFKKLKDKKPSLIYFENKLLAVGNKYILTFDDYCGLSEFKNEKEKIRERHSKEFDYLFKPSNLEWAAKIDDSIFENLIKDLLEREPNVSRVRKLAHTRERDGGTDLIAEWNVLKSKAEIKNLKDTPYKRINVVIQCKAYKDGVGKSSVIDIRDTVDSRDYDGYFLAVSSYTKKSLSDYLDKLRIAGKIWVDWWTRSEIEDRLIKHEDLLFKYSSIISVLS